MKYAQGNSLGVITTFKEKSYIFIIKITYFSTGSAALIGVDR